MTEFYDLAKNLKYHNYQEAINQYTKNLEEIKDSDEKIKKYLNELNTFFYTYFLIKYDRDLDSLARENQKLIEEAAPSQLSFLGHDILKSYLNTFSDEFLENENEIIDSAIKFINDNYKTKITLDLLSEKLHISKNYLCNLFRIKTGFGFCEYLNVVRLNEAKKLINESYSFEYISYECGFSSQSHFSTTFKKYLGLTPSQYKRSVA